MHILITRREREEVCSILGKVSDSRLGAPRGRYLERPMDVAAAQGVQGQAERLPAGVQVVFYHLGEAGGTLSLPV